MSEEEKGFTFHYYANYKGIAISLSMPVRTEPYWCEELHPFFKGLAPGLNSKYGEYVGFDFILLAENIGISFKLAQKLLNDVVNSHQTIIDTYNESHMPEEQRNVVLAYVERRINLLKITTL
ncbi:HipA N-terminal domain-containing protein [Proteus hauseri]|uniref:HipA N-terminal domain-containing protein n=1 Tax=Proteus hauseri TaxID=183417 RepID=UPI0032DA6CAC